MADRLAVLGIACEDLDAQIAKLESEVDAVRKREDRDRGLLDSGSVSDSKQLEELQHELGTLERRQASLEDTLLEVMERREQLAASRPREQAAIDALDEDLAAARPGARRDRSPRSSRPAPSGAPGARRAWPPHWTATCWSSTSGNARRRASVPAGCMGGRCGACRIELDRGEMARISAAAEDEVLRCPECGAILLRIKASGE